jgi:hypothetical protein
MYTAYDMNFGHCLVIILPDDIQHIFYTQFPAFFPMCIQTRVRTELAGKYADIGRLYMKVPVKICFVTMP